MRFRLILLALPAFVLLALLASGCGGGGSSSTTTAKKPQVEEKPQLSKAEFITQGDGICGEVNTAIGSVGESAAESTSQTTQVANLYIGMVEGLQRLGRPSPATGYSEFMGAAEKLAMVEGEIKKASEAEEVATLETASQEAVPAVEEFRSEAAVYGFEDCSEAPHAPEAAPESSGGTEEVAPEESGGIEVAPEEVAPEEEFVPEEEVAPEEEFVPETGGAGGEIEEVAPEETAPESESGGIGPE
ncbi:MAG TPA: hypothetical protein VN522_15195 [Solirubrobacterales bacterium]|nr:hypothetical protein [Solirubrobacterales bacterium]